VPCAPASDWPETPDALVAVQTSLAGTAPEPWQPPDGPAGVGACWVCFPRGDSGPGRRHDPAWAAAVVMRDGRLLAARVVAGQAGAPYTPGLMALRAGPLLERTVRALPSPPDVLLLDATARDHPRRAGLALHLGARLDLPTVGVTHRPLLAAGDWPEDRRGATSPLSIDETVVGCWLRTRAGVRPLAVHPGWRTDVATAVPVVLAASRRRTPEPLARARELARRARAAG
jgi:deoxyribonuclease V